MRGGMSDYSLGLAQDRWDEQHCDRCGDVTDRLSPDGLCDRCEEELDEVAQVATPAGAVLALVAITALFVGGLAVAAFAPVQYGGPTTTQPWFVTTVAAALVLAGAALLAAYVHAARARDGGTS